ncbi:hypothetical protein Tco_0257435 [Tanacetum coccineum]
MMTTNQGLSLSKIEQIVVQRVANAIGTIAIYKTKTRVACGLINKVDKIAENASNKRKWKGDHGGSLSQNKGHKMSKAHVVGPINKKVYVGKLPHCNRCKYHHTGPCTAKLEIARGLVIKQRIIITVNLIPPDHVDDVPVIEPNQHDDVHVVPEPVLVDEDEDPEEDEFKEEEEPQEEEDDMEVDPLNPPPPASESEPEDVIEVEDEVESEDEPVPASVYEVGESSTAPFLREDSDGLFPGLMRRDINSLFDLGNEVRSSVEQGTAVMEKLVEKLGNAEEKDECKKLKKELEEARFSNTFLRMQNERVERDLYWTRVRTHEFYQEMIRRGFVFEERPNEAINVPIKDKKSPSSEPRGSPRDS